MIQIAEEEKKPIQREVKKMASGKIRGMEQECQTIIESMKNTPASTHRARTEKANKVVGPRRVAGSEILRNLKDKNPVSGPASRRAKHRPAYLDEDDEDHDSDLNNNSPAGQTEPDISKSTSKGKVTFENGLNEDRQKAGKTQKSRSTGLLPEPQLEPGSHFLNEELKNNSKPAKGGKKSQFSSGQDGDHPSNLPRSNVSQKTVGKKNLVNKTSSKRRLSNRSRAPLASKSLLADQEDFDEPLPDPVLPPRSTRPKYANLNQSKTSAAPLKKVPSFVLDNVSENQD